MLFLKKNTDTQDQKNQTGTNPSNPWGEWDEYKYEVDPNTNDLVEVKIERFKKHEITDNDGLITIDHQQIKKYEETRKELIQNSKANLVYPKTQNTQIFFNKQMNLTNSSNSLTNDDDILPQQFKNQQEEKIVQEGKQLALKIKGQGFSSFKLRRIRFQVKCSTCLIFQQTEFIDLVDNKAQYPCDLSCTNCQKKLPFKFQKFLVQDQLTNLWKIGQVSVQKDVEIQISAIIIMAVCNCLSNSSRFPKTLIALDSKVNRSPQGDVFKIKKDEQARIFCHGCCKELFFQPELLIISQK